MKNGYWIARKVTLEEPRLDIVWVRSGEDWVEIYEHGDDGLYTKEDYELVQFLCENLEDMVFHVDFKNSVKERLKNESRR